MAGLGHVVEVASGRSLRCAREAEGNVLCWGDADWRRLAGGGAPGFFEHPSKVRDLPRATAIAAGSQHACAIAEGGEVWCWGRVTGGLAGLAGTRCTAPAWMQAPKSLVETVCQAAVTVEPLPKARLIAASLQYTCVVDEEDAIWCWGGREPGRPPGPFAGAPVRIF